MSEHKTKKPKLKLIMPDDPVEVLPEPKDGYDTDWVNEFAVHRADMFLGILLEAMQKEFELPGRTSSEVVVSQTMTFMLMACFINPNMLETDALDRLFPLMKASALNYIKANKPMLAN